MVRLDQLRREVAVSEIAAAASRQRAEYEECRANLAKLGAEISKRKSACSVEKSMDAQCHAKNEAHRSNSGIGGCLLGIGAAVVTGGAAAPLALGGCGVGLLAGSATGEPCGSSTCVDDETAIATTLMQEQHLTTVPTCRGYAGMMVTAAATPAGTRVFVTATDPFGPAARAGLRPGDRIDAVKDQQVLTPQALNASLEAPALEGLPVRFARPGFSGQVVLTLDERQNRAGL